MGSMTDFGKKTVYLPIRGRLYLLSSHGTTTTNAMSLGIASRDTHARFFPDSLISCAPLRPRATRSAWPEHGERIFNLFRMSTWGLSLSQKRSFTPTTRYNIRHQSGRFGGIRHPSVSWIYPRWRPVPHMALLERVRHVGMRYHSG